MVSRPWERLPHGLVDQEALRGGLAARYTQVLVFHSCLYNHTAHAHPSSWNGEEHIKYSLMQVVQKRSDTEITCKCPFV